MQGTFTLERFRVHESCRSDLHSQTAEHAGHTKKKSTGGFPVLFNLLTDPMLTELIRHVGAQSNYWRGTATDVAQTAIAPAPPVGSLRITPESSEQKSLCPLEPGATGVALELKLLAGAEGVPVLDGVTTNA